MTEGGQAFYECLNSITGPTPAAAPDDSSGVTNSFGTATPTRNDAVALTSRLIGENLKRVLNEGRSTYLQIDPVAFSEPVWCGLGHGQSGDWPGRPLRLRG